ncbi:cytochrome P450 [Pisolithus sp. B1]|nr:cytochrome P450 [Pisolithus sp. B1]
MDSALVVASLLLPAIVCMIFLYVLRPSLAHIRGPSPASFFLGATLELYQEQAGETDFRWQRRYGGIVRFKSILGEDQLLITDLKALRHILGAPDLYPFQPERRIMSGFINGKGIAWACGDAHKRQKRIILPAFGAPHSETFLKASKESAERLCAKWMDVVSGTDDERAVVDMYEWLSRATLDVIGQAAFGVYFGCLDDPNHILVRSYRNTIATIFGSPSPQQIFTSEILKYLPTWMTERGLELSKDKKCMLVKGMRETVVSVARELVRRRRDEYAGGGMDEYKDVDGENEDALGLLMKEYMKDENEEEILAQVRTLLIAGHETTTHTLEWALLELAKRPSAQARMREEVRQAEATVRGRDGLWRVADLQGMVYTVAVVKEVLRYHCTLHHVYRVAAQDDVVSLAKPIRTELALATEIRIPKGTRIIGSIAGYNRNPDVWGDDADVFKPDRWMSMSDDGGEAVMVGVYANLLTFWGGPRACIGWRLAVIETQIFLIEIISRFEVSLSEKATRIRREACGIVVPTVEGEVEKGVQLPLVISVAQQ